MSQQISYNGPICPMRMYQRAGLWSASAAWGNCPGCSLWTSCSRRPGWRIFSVVRPRTGVHTLPYGSLLCSLSPECPWKQIFFKHFASKGIWLHLVQGHLPSAVDQWWCFCPLDHRRVGTSHRQPWRCQSAAALTGSEGLPPSGPPSWTQSASCRSTTVIWQDLWQVFCMPEACPLERRKHSTCPFFYAECREVGFHTLLQYNEFTLL